MTADGNEKRANRTEAFREKNARRSEAKRIWGHAYTTGRQLRRCMPNGAFGRESKEHYAACAVGTLGSES